METEETAREIDFLWNSIVSCRGGAFSIHELEFTDNEIRIVLNTLDFYSRIWIGQYDHMLWEMSLFGGSSQ